MQDDTDDEPELVPEPTQEARSLGSEQPKTPRRGPAWKPSLRGGEAVDH